MQFSLHLPINHIAPKGDFQSMEGVRVMARAIEQAGVDAAHVSDHPIPQTDWLHNDGAGHDAIDPFTGLAFTAAATTTLKVIIGVLILPYRNPFLTAKSAATLQVLSDNRLILGVGVGYQEDEFSALGVPFRERGALTDEALETIRQLWSGDGQITKKGRHFDAPGNHARPVPSVVPPIWIGGGSDKAVERAARLGDGWLPFIAPPTNNKITQDSSINTVGELGEKIKHVKEMRAKLGKTAPFDFGMTALRAPKGTTKEEAEKFCAMVNELQAVGVNWVRYKPPAPTRAAFLEYVDWFGKEVVPHYKKK